VNEFQHRVPKQEWVLVEPPRHFVKVGRQMLRRDSMPPFHKLGGGPFLAAPSQGAGAGSDCAAEASPASSRVGVEARRARAIGFPDTCPTRTAP